MATVIIPTPLRKFTNNLAKLQIEDAQTVQETITKITFEFPDLKKHLLDSEGKLRTFVNVFVGDNDIRDLQQENTLIKEESIISIIPAIAGGK